MIGIELFSGPGGMGLGARQAGVKVAIAVEKDPFAAQTYILNHREATVVVDDIVNIIEYDFERKNEQVILFGGPPCQGYSNSNRMTRSKENPGNWLFKEFIKSARIINPDWIVIENVPGLKNMDNGFFLEQICNDLHGAGYTPNFKILNSADFGVPQKRERIFIVASRHGVAFEFPKGMFKNHVSVADAISDLPVLNNGNKESKLPYKSKAKSDFAKLMRGQKRIVTQNYVSKNSELVIERYKHISQGGNWQEIPLELMKNYKDPTRCHHGIYRRLKQDEPAFVIANYRKSMLIHPTEDRGLSLREAARLQSFPDSYVFCGPLVHMQQQVGDAVPPLLAKAVFERIKRISA
ncbi:DNA cytosine methyltransferase [Muricauda ruestringensis]|uniref:DNA (cytosine-5-)-methyltransferase n=1 Tax=Flagellimonas aurea TaxID=2915619 RepID=A0ABS3G5M9_9FLAO|nr:DNA cytosine methyltransferase [Allomuricauda aurea]MAO17277.1 DNA (cytosine-5-)-methyltransferase [Allomuricauda sp.]MBO0354723.1 DNA cytosine methyltransferase [Allomuricauda aurea]|tara:strand:- start:5 stop:1057 length:1053 start_codon:yes stop_codon:yes gene_type:complete